MLDVHPPHPPPHTWRDFFIHVGTICVGLLIAIGLEQTVEFFHRQHERHLLEHELHAEAQIIQRNAEIDVAQYDSFLKFLLELRKDASLGIATHGHAVLPVRQYIAPPMGHGVQSAGVITIINPIWESARSDGRLALLPEGLKRAYGVVSFRKGEWETRYANFLAARDAMNAFVFQFADISTPRSPDLSRMSESQLIEFRSLTTIAFEKLRSARTTTIDLSGELNLVLGDEPIDQQSLTPADGKFLVQARAAHPEDYAKMAAEIDAEDAARDNATPQSAKPSN
jgi:hypothetical protein